MTPPTHSTIGRPRRPGTVQRRCVPQHSRHRRRGTFREYSRRNEPRPGQGRVCRRGTRCIYLPCCARRRPGHRPSNTCQRRNPCKFPQTRRPIFPLHKRCTCRCGRVPRPPSRGRSSMSQDCNQRTGVPQHCSISPPRKLRTPPSMQGMPCPQYMPCKMCRQGWPRYR
jgi:hypothetical protein